MGAKNSVLTGAAGEAYVLYQIQHRGLLAAFSPPNAFAADILVFSPAMQVGSMVQVKTRTSGADGGWHMSEKHERLVHPRLFYAFVDLQPSVPTVHVIPSAIVAEVVTRSHRAWLGLPGVHGQVHRDTALRRVAPHFPHAVPGYPDGWLAAYLDRWDYLTAEPADGELVKGS